MTRLKIGTRGSKLALIQTDIVLEILGKVEPDLQFEKVVISTVGDRFRTKSFGAFGLKGIFEKEIDVELAKGKIDFAVHSLKDIPSEGYVELTIAAIPKRDNPHDVLVSSNGEKLSELKSGSIIGTSSPRRMIQIKHVRPDLEVKSLRGNVETRISKITDGEFDAVVVAEAGLKRLGLQSKISEKLSLDAFTPAPGQGALAVVARRDDRATLRLLSRIDDTKSRNEVVLERYVASKLGGGCKAPIGVIARQNGNSMSVYTCSFSVDGRRKIASAAKGNVNDLLVVGDEVSDNLIGMGATRIINEWRKASVKW